MQFELAPFALPADYGEGIVSLAEMKAHLSIDASDTYHDVIIEVYRDAAVDMVEKYCGVRLGTLTGGESLPPVIKLGVWPVTAITSITWLDGDGADVTGDAADWRIVRRDEIALKPGRTLPSGVAAGVAITFGAGFDDDTRPKALVQAVRMFAAHLFLNRETVMAGTVANEIPLGFRQLCGAYRMPVI
jgi:uncharacterized phiE125 gp8 family phage protein